MAIRFGFRHLQLSSQAGLQPSTMVHGESGSPVLLHEHFDPQLRDSSNSDDTSAVVAPMSVQGTDTRLPTVDALHGNRADEMYDTFRQSHR